jgi:hypothetical protein
MALGQHYLAFVHDPTLLSSNVCERCSATDLFEALRRNRAVVEGVVVLCQGRRCTGVHPLPPGMQEHHACILYSTEFFDAPMEQRIATADARIMNSVQVGPLTNIFMESAADSGGAGSGGGRSVQTYKIPSYSYYKAWHKWMLWCSASPKLPPDLHAGALGNVAAAVAATAATETVNTNVPTATCLNDAAGEQQTRCDAAMATGTSTSRETPAADENDLGPVQVVDAVELIGAASTIVGLGMLAGV